jgi:hypothetical protein
MRFPWAWNWSKHPPQIVNIVSLRKFIRMIKESLTNLIGKASTLRLIVVIAINLQPAMFFESSHG